MAPAVDTTRDSDYDGTPDVSDGCPYDFYKTAPGDCGCGLIEPDTDNDGTSDCIDLCPTDPNKIAPGNCGCDNAETTGCGSGGGGSQTPTNLDLGGGVTMEMVLIPAGTFMMGLPDKQRENLEDQHPQHQVTISRAFYIGKYEVTQAQWRAFMVIDPLRSPKFKGDNRPVERATWDECQTFCQKVSSKTGWKARLPTEAEWEYACRAGTTTTYYFGDDRSQLGQYAWFSENSGKQTHDVGGKLPNAWGLYDMSGNVGEWCQDRVGYYSAGPQTDPTGPSSEVPGWGDGRVYRGGDWDYNLVFCEVTFRMNLTPGGRDEGVGFRMAMDSE